MIRPVRLALAAAVCLGCTAPPPPPAPRAPEPQAAPPPPSPRSLLAAPPAFSGRVARIETRGAGASVPTLEKALATRVGELYDPARIQDDLRAIWALRLFDDVSVEAEADPSGVVLTYVVALRPRIERTSFSGVPGVREAELAELVRGLRGAPADPQAIDGAARAVRERYVELGHRAARVETETARAGEGGVEVRFVVDEGPRSVIARWSFTGNARATEAVLRAQMKSGAYNAAGGVYNEENWERDAMLITSYYYDQGMLEARVDPIEITTSPDGTALTVVVPVFEGPVFHLGKLEVSDPAAGKGAPRPTGVIRIKRGDVFSRIRMIEELLRVREWYAKTRHRTVEVTPSTELDKAAGRVDLVLQVTDTKP